MVARIFGVFSVVGADDERDRRSSRRSRCCSRPSLAVVQRDIKKVLAYSTVSQLGYMMAGLAVGAATRRRLPSLDARVLQGASLPRRRERDPRRAQQRHVRDGRTAEVHADHLRDVHHRLPRARRRPAARRASGRRTRSSPPRSRPGTRSSSSVALVTAFLTAFYMARACTLTFFGRYRRMPIAGGAADDDAHGAPRRAAARVAAVDDVAADHPRRPQSSSAAWSGRRCKNLFAEWFHFEDAAPRRVRRLDRAAVDRDRLRRHRARACACTPRAIFGFGVIDPLAKLGPLYRAAERRFFIDDFYMKVDHQARPVPALAVRLQRPRPEG